MFRFSSLHVDSLGYPAPGWRWRVALPELPGFDFAAFGQFENLDNNGGLGVFNLPAERVSFLPMEKVPSRPSYGGGRNRYYPDYNDVDPMSLTMYETESFPVFRYFRHWKRLVKDDDGYYGLPSIYKRDIYVFLYGQHVDYPNLALKIKGGWTMDVQQLDLDQENSSRVQIVANIQMDDIDPITDRARLWAGS